MMGGEQNLRTNPDHLVGIKHSKFLQGGAYGPGNWNPYSQAVSP
jgi:hypothetical protein